MKYRVKNLQKISISFDISHPNGKSEGIHLSGKHDPKNKTSRLLKEREYRSPEITRLITRGVLGTIEYPDPEPEKPEKTPRRASGKGNNKKPKPASSVEE